MLGRLLCLLNRHRGDGNFRWDDDFQDVIEQCSRCRCYLDLWDEEPFWVRDAQDRYDQSQEEELMEESTTDGD